MCKSAIEGGQRCPSGARTRFDSAQAKFEAVCAADDPTSADVDTARQGWEDAASDYASTDEGRAYLAQIADESADLHVKAIMQTLIVRGDDIRAANKTTGASVRTMRSMAGGATRKMQALADPDAPSATARTSRSAVAVLDRDPVARAYADPDTSPSWSARDLGLTHHGDEAMVHESQQSLDRVAAALARPDATDTTLAQAFHDDPATSRVAGHLVDHPQAGEKVMARALTTHAQNPALTRALVHPSCPARYLVAAVEGPTDIHASRSTKYDHITDRDEREALKNALGSRWDRQSHGERSRTSNGDKIMTAARVRSRLEPQIAVALALHEDDIQDRIAARNVLAGHPVSHMDDADRKSLARELSAPHKANPDLRRLPRDKILDDRLTADLLTHADHTLLQDDRRSLATLFADHPERGVRRRAKKIRDRD